jgi:tRNA (Thr-GGU) A37 N-methylase
MPRGALWFTSQDQEMNALRGQPMEKYERLSIHDQKVAHNERMHRYVHKTALKRAAVGNRFGEGIEQLDDFSHVVHVAHFYHGVHVA